MPKLSKSPLMLKHQRNLCCRFNLFLMKAKHLTLSSSLFSPLKYSISGKKPDRRKRQRKPDRPRANRTHQRNSQANKEPSKTLDLAVLVPELEPSGVDLLSVFVNDQFLNRDLENKIKVHIILARAYHSLFMHNMGAKARVIHCYREKVTYVVNNLLLPWVVDVATDMDIPCAVLWVQSCVVFSTYYYYHRGLVEFPTETNPNISVCLPGIPTMTPEDITSFLFPSTSKPYKSLTKAILEQFRNIDKASKVFINSFTELELDVIDAIAKYAQLIPVGPLVEPEFDSGSTIRGDLIKATDDCLEWLDTQAPQSVIYISLGSLCTFTKEEMTEIAYELMTNHRPFLWVVRPDSFEFLPQGFLEEVKGRGMVVGWSPQNSVLNHKSTGCFLTHCGWNSTLETLTAGVPVIAYPQFGDQVTDAKFLVDIYKVGVRLKAPVQRNSLHAAIEGVMDGPDAEAIKEHATKWKEAAMTAVRKGGSSDINIQAFVDEVIMKMATAV